MRRCFLIGLQNVKFKSHGWALALSHNPDGINSPQRLRLVVRLVEAIDCLPSTLVGFPQTETDCVPRLEFHVAAEDPVQLLYIDAVSPLCRIALQ